MDRRPTCLAPGLTNSGALSMLEFLSAMAIIPKGPTASRGRRRLPSAAAVAAACLLGAAGAQASTGAIVHVGTKTVTVTGGQITAGSDVSGTFTLRQAIGQAAPITLHGMSIRALLGAAGVDPSTVSGVTVGSAAPLSPVDIGDPPPFPQGPALITVSNGTSRFFRPVRNASDVNAPDYISTGYGQPIDVFVEGGSVAATSVQSSQLRVTASAIPTQADPHQLVSFIALVDNPPPGVDLGYSWSFGDGASTYGAAPNHAYAADGDYPATVTVSGSGKSGISSVVVIHVGHPKRRSTGTGLGNSTATGSGAGGTGTGKGGTGGGSGTGGKGQTQPKAQPKPATQQPAQTAKPVGVAKAQTASKTAGGPQLVHGVLLADAGSPFDLRLSPPPPSGSAGAAHNSRGGAGGVAAVVLGLAFALTIATLGGLKERRRGTISPA